MSEYSSFRLYGWKDIAKKLEHGEIHLNRIANALEKIAENFEPVSKLLTMIQEEWEKNNGGT